MPLFDKDRDILMGYDTDIAFENGDLMMTEGPDYLIRKIFKLLISELNDWRLDPQITASPNIFIGEKNTRETAKRLEGFLRNRIQPHVAPVESSVRVVPINHESVKVYIDLIFVGQTLATIPFTLDFINGFTYTQFDSKVDKVVSSKNLKMNAPRDIRQPNPIKDIISRQRRR